MTILLPNTFIGNKYEIVKPLNEDEECKTYKALDSNNHSVVIKVFSLTDLADKTTLDLLTKRGKMLSELDHSRIPSYVDYFQGTSKKDADNFYLVQEFIEEESLALKRKNGWIPKQKELEDIAIQLLEIISYLQVLNPPIIHGNIKAKNILINSENQVFLVNFNLKETNKKQEENKNKPNNKIDEEELRKSKFFTYTTVEKEQKKQGVLITDLHDLGLMLLSLITGQNQENLSLNKLNKNWQKNFYLNTNFVTWLEKMIDSNSDKQFSSARKALTDLQTIQGRSQLLVERPKKLENTTIKLTKNKGKLIIKIPSLWLRSKNSFLLSLIPVTVILLRFTLLVFILLIIYGIIKDYNNIDLSKDWQEIQNFLSLLLGYCFFDLLVNLLIKKFFFRGIFKTHLEITSRYWGIKQNIFWWTFKKIRRNTKDIVSIKTKNFKLPWGKESLTFLDFHLLKDQECIGLFLSPEENEWLLGEIKYFLSNYNM